MVFGLRMRPAPCLDLPGEAACRFPFRDEAPRPGGRDGSGVRVTPKLWLIGMMSSGKTKVGRRLAKRSGLPLVDLDDLIVERAEMTIPQIFDTHGEPAFRAMESEELARIAASPQRLVVATGGGAILDGTSRRLMRETGLVVWLKPSIASLIAKGKTRNRPLLLGHDDLAARYTEIWEARKHLYEEAAHFSIPMDGRTRKQAAKEVWKLWRES